MRRAHLLALSAAAAALATGQAQAAPMAGGVLSIDAILEAGLGVAAKLTIAEIAGGRRSGDVA